MRHSQWEDKIVVGGEEKTYGFCTKNHEEIAWDIEDIGKWCPACSALDDMIYENEKAIEKVREEQRYCDKCQALIDLKS